MARGRIISKSLGISRKFHALLGESGNLTEFSGMLYQLIVANTDDYGRLDADAFTIKHGVLPISPRPESDFEKALQRLHHVGLILRYESGGSLYLQIVDFEKHQTGLHKRSEKSKYPNPPETLEPQGPREIPGNSGNVPPKIREEKGREEKGREEEKELPPQNGGLPKRTWLTPYAECWESHLGGEMPCSRFSRALRNVEKKLGAPETLRRWDCYLSVTEGKFANAEAFARALNDYDPDNPRVVRQPQRGFLSSSEKNAEVVRELLRRTGDA